MLEDKISFLGMLVIKFMIVLLVIGILGGLFNWYRLNGQANFIADSMSRYGCYTTIAEQALDNFCLQAKIDKSKIRVTVSPSMSRAAYGQPVSVRLDYDYNFRIGQINLAPWPLSANGTAVSTYIQGMNPNQFFTGDNPVR